MKKIFLTILFLFGSFHFGPLFAQQPIYGPSTSTVDPKSIFANPSLLSFQRPKLAIGVKGYHLGFLDESGIPLKQGYLTLSYPFIFRDMIGAGIGVQYFDSPIYSRSFYSANVAARLFRFISVGASLSAFHISYDESKFNLEHPNDPVFAGGTSKTTINSTFGVFAQPFEFLGVGIGVRNLTKPNLSLIGDDVNLDSEFFIGATYTHGPFKGTLELFNQEHGLDGRVYFELFSSHGNFLRTGSNVRLDNMHIEAQMHVSGPFSVGYNYELPMSEILGQSGGSHMLSVIFEFDRLPSLPDRVRPPTYQLSFQEPSVNPKIEPRIYALSEINYLRFYEKQIHREIDEDIPDESVRTLSEYDMGTIDNVFREFQYPYQKDRVAPVPEEVEFTTAMSPRYQEMLDQLGIIPRMRHPVSIVADDDHLMKAFGIHNILRETDTSPDDIRVGTPRFDTSQDSIKFYTRVDRNTIIPYEDIVILVPDSTIINLYPAYINPTVRHWTMVIENSDFQPIKQFSGTGQIPESIVWDWHNDADMLIEPDVYSYFLRWEDTQGVVRESDRRNIYVQKFLRKITIEVTRDGGKIPDLPDRINLIIKN